jgi:hypothetical protein
MFLSEDVVQFSPYFQADEPAEYSTGQIVESLAEIL